MSDDENDPKEVLLKQQRKEKKDLQAEIQALKKTATKGDKKKKKEVADTVIKLESDLQQKHKQELEALDKGDAAATQDSSRVSSIDEPEIKDGEDEDEDEEEAALGPLGNRQEKTKISKAQKRRDAKATKEKERQKEIEKQEEINKLGPRVKEQEAIKEKLNNKKLKLKEISSDGDCMFASILHQLQLLQIQSSVQDLRAETANQLQENQEEYIPFLSNPKTGDMLTSTEYTEYCDTMRSTHAWGGQVELRALSRVLKKPIQVIQGEGPDILVGEEYGDQTLTLTYHRHLHGLGEHYNSVIQS